MSDEVIAGLVGGLLALGGAFGVQLLANWQQQRAHTRKMAAAFIAEQRSLFIMATEARVGFSHDPTGFSPSDNIATYQQCERIGTELALLVDRETAKLIRAALEANLVLTVSTVPSATDEKTWKARSSTQETATKTAADQLDRKYGKGRRG